MNDDRLRALYARGLADGEAEGGGFVGGHPDPEALRALAERTGPEAGRLDTLDHVMACATCRHEFELLRAVSQSGARVQRRAAPAWAVALPLAAIAAAAVFWVRSSERWAPGAMPEVVREVPGGASGEVVTVGPSGAVPAGAATLVWRRMPEATRYVVEVVTAGGDSVFAATTADTTYALPAAARLTPGAAYEWWVRAERADGSSARSRPARLIVRD